MKAKLWAISVAIFAILTSCGPTDNFGYPSKVTFGREGGTKICSGTSSFYYVGINNYDGNGSRIPQQGENDTLVATYKWLTVKYRIGMDSHIKIIAEPNTTGKNEPYI